MEANLQHSLHKIEIHWLKIIPIVLSFNMFTSTILSYLDVDDGVEGLTFNRWIADMKWLGIPIPWDEFL